MISAVLVLTSCGWHLRGTQATLPDNLKSVRLVTPKKEKKLHIALERALISAGATVIEDTDSPAYRLNVTDVSHERRGVSTSSRGKIAEYALTSQITFSVNDQTGQEVLSSATVSRQRTYFFDEDRVTSAFEEEKLLIDELQRDLVQQIVRRYRSIQNN